MKIPEKPPEFGALFEKISPERFGLILAAGDSTGGKYRHWSELRHLDPPEDLSLEEWWFGIKLARTAASHPFPLWDKKGKLFTLTRCRTRLRGLFIVWIRARRDTSPSVSRS